MSSVMVRSVVGAALGLCLAVGATAPAAAGAPGSASGSSVRAAPAVAEQAVSMSVSEVDLDGPAVNPITVTIRNDSSKSMSKVTASISGPVGWTVSGSQTLPSQIRPGASTELTFWVQVPERRPGFRTYTFSATATYRGGDGAGSVTASRATHSGTVLPNLAAAYNNVGVTNETATTAGNFDGEGNSFSAQKLADKGLTPGAAVSALGASFTWPSAAAGTPGNVASAGQAVALSGKGSRLAFLGSGAGTSATGIATVHYTDGTSSTGSFGFPNWSFQDATAHGATLVASSVGRNRPSGYGDAAYAYRVFANSITIDPTKTVEFVILPSNGAVHVFDMKLVP
ncbi:MULTISPECIES: NEW3 domain-containing protein [unclassified Knoellia]|uniref:NEW3 domain-containing protein n=1 Tax=Knoellia altitudinis TaxID=3404795 RepID=UPI003607B025